MSGTRTAVLTGLRSMAGHRVLVDEAIRDSPGDECLAARMYVVGALVEELDLGDPGYPGCLDGCHVVRVRVPSGPHLNLSVRASTVDHWVVGPNPDVPNEPARFDLLSLRGSTVHGLDLCGARVLCLVAEDAWVQNANLTGATIGTMSARYADLSHLSASGACFKHADLHGADLSYANLRDAVFDEVDFEGADLSHADVTGMIIGGEPVGPDDLAALTVVSPGTSVGRDPEQEVWALVKPLVRDSGLVVDWRSTPVARNWRMDARGGRPPVAGLVLDSAGMAHAVLMFGTDHEPGLGTVAWCEVKPAPWLALSRCARRAFESPFHVMVDRRTNTDELVAFGDRLLDLVRAVLERRRLGA